MIHSIQSLLLVFQPKNLKKYVFSDYNYSVLTSKVAYSFKVSPSCGCLCLLFHTKAHKLEEINFLSSAPFSVASELLLEGIIVVFPALARAVRTHLEKYVQCSAEKSIQQR